MSALLKENKLISWMIVFLWMALIFYLSHQPATASNEVSTGILTIIVQTIGKVAPFIATDLEGFHYLIRKSAHFFAYFILGILVMNAFRNIRLEGYRRIILVLGICVAYAISDEVHQLFIPGRSGEVTDVLIDSIGAAVGVAVYLIKRK